MDFLFKQIEKMIKHKIRTLVIVVAIFILPPIAIHFLFNGKALFPFLAANWSAGEFLGYYAAFLSAIGTVFLGSIALWQNYNTAENDKKKVEAVFGISKRLYNENIAIFICELKNISQNIAIDFKIDKVELIDINKLECFPIIVLFPNYKNGIQFKPGEVIKLKLKNTINKKLNKNYKLIFDFSYFDVLSNKINITKISLFENWNFTDDYNFGTGGGGEEEEEEEDEE